MWRGMGGLSDREKVHRGGKEGRRGAEVFMQVEGARVYSTAKKQRTQRFATEVHRGRKEGRRYAEVFLGLLEIRKVDSTAKKQSPSPRPFDKLRDRT